MDWPSDTNIGLVNGKFHDGDPLQGIAPSLDPAPHMNAITEELINIIQTFDGNPDEAETDQVATLLKAYIDYAVGDGLRGYVEERLNRSLNTNYINTESYAIHLQVILDMPAGQSAAILSPVGVHTCASVGNNSSVDTVFTLYAIVPPGVSYSVISSGATSVVGWYEYK